MTYLHRPTTRQCSMLSKFCRKQFDQIFAQIFMWQRNIFQINSHSWDLRDAAPKAISSVYIHYDKVWGALEAHCTLLSDISSHLLRLCCKLCKVDEAFKLKTGLRFPGQMMQRHEGGVIFGGVQWERVELFLRCYACVPRPEQLLLTYKSNRVLLNLNKPRLCFNYYTIS